MTVRRPRRHLAMRALLDSQDGRDALLAVAPELPPDVGRWLARLCLLHGLPFNTLVADAGLLPAESVRFFFVDQNWLDALVDGALSVAAAAPPQAALTRLHRPAVQAAARAAAATLRGRARPLAELPPGEPEPPWSGLLLRSAAVAGWPGLEITGYRDAAGLDPLPPLRIDRPAPSVLLAIFRGVATRFEISRPSQGLSFGVIRSQSGDPARVAVRFIGGGPQFPPGKQPPGKPMVSAGFRDAARGVLDIQGLRGRLETELRAVYAPDQPPPLHPAAFGIQLVAAPEWRAFVPEPGGRDAG